MKVSFSSLAIFTLLVGLAVGCTFTGTQKHFQQTGLERAAFDLNCPADQLQVQDLGGSQIGVEGCGQRAVYVYTGGAWVNNTMTPK